MDDKYIPGDIIVKGVLHGALDILNPNYHGIYHKVYKKAREIGMKCRDEIVLFNREKQIYICVFCLNNKKVKRRYAKFWLENGRRKTPPNGIFTSHKPRGLILHMKRNHYGEILNLAVREGLLTSLPIYTIKLIPRELVKIDGL